MTGIENDNKLERVIKELQAGIDEQENFRWLAERYHSGVFNFFRKRGIPKEDCRDLTQETFFRVYKSMGSFRGKAPFNAWLFEIAANIWRNKLRSWKAKRRIPVDKKVPISDLPVEPPLEEPDPQETALKKERIKRLRTAIKQLPPRMRECVLHRMQGRTLSEAAILMKVADGTTKSLWSEAIKRLKVLLSEEDLKQLGFEYSKEKEQ